MEPMALTRAVMWAGKSAVRSELLGASTAVMKAET
jgi:hypothetical protein